MPSANSKPSPLAVVQAAAKEFSAFGGHCGAFAVGVGRYFRRAGHAVNLGFVMPWDANGLDGLEAKLDVIDADLYHVVVIVDGYAFDGDGAATIASLRAFVKAEYGDGDPTIQSYQFTPKTIRWALQNTSGCGDPNQITHWLLQQFPIRGGRRQAARLLKLDELTTPQRAALWQWMWHEGGFGSEQEALQACRRLRYRIQSYPTKDVVDVWRRWMQLGGARSTVEADGPLYSEDKRRVKKIMQTKMDWPYVVGGGRDFEGWAKDEMNHGDGFHRILAAYWSGKPTVEFLYIVAPGDRQAAGGWPTPPTRESPAFLARPDCTKSPPPKKFSFCVDARPRGLYSP